MVSSEEWLGQRALTVNLRWLTLLLAFSVAQLNAPELLLSTPLWLLLGTFLVSNLALLRVPLPLFRHHPLWFLLVLLDVGLVSGLIYLLGEARGDSFFLYLPAVGLAAGQHGQRGIFASVFTAVAAYLGLVYALSPKGEFLGQMLGRDSLLFRVALLLVIGVLFGYLAQRLRAQVRVREAHVARQRDLEAVVVASHAFSGTLKQEDVLSLLIQQVTELVGAFRCSVVHVDEGRRSGDILLSRELLASGKEGRVRSLKVDMALYPEFREAISRQGCVRVNSVADSDLVAPVANRLRKIGISSLLAVPLTVDDPVVGTLLLSLARRRATFTEREVNVCELLAALVSRALKSAYIHESLANENLSLQKLAISDPLTGLYNRRFFDMRLSEEFRLASRHNLPLSLILMDVDHFKQINDTHGHLAGDRVLRALSDVIQGNLRQSDCAARYGGEEFVLLLPLTGRDGAMAKAEEIRLAIRELTLPDSGGQAHTSVSVGVASYDPAVCRDGHMLLAMADQAVYMAKRGGRDQVRYCAEAPSDRPAASPSGTKRRNRPATKPTSRHHS